MTSPSTSDDALVVRRADIEAAVLVHRRESNGVAEWIIAIGGFGGTMALWLSGIVSDRSGVLMPTFVGGWAIMISALLLMMHRYSRRIAKLGLQCPGCAEPLVELVKWRTGVKYADRVLATGRCPNCGAQCFVEDARDEAGVGFTD